MTLQDRIARLLRCANALTAAEVAQITGATQEAAQDALRALDDKGDAIMRNGFYRASERLRRACHE